jgi:hypothetical protein
MISQRAKANLPAGHTEALLQAAVAQREAGKDTRFLTSGINDGPKGNK